MAPPAKQTTETIMKEGHYKYVHCNGIAHAPGHLGGGTGTFIDSTQTFSCGTFTEGDWPKIGSYYNLNGEHEEKWYEFPRWKCTGSGETSDFKEN